MPQATHVYWKTKEECESSDISGWCMLDRVPDHGHVDAKPLPTKVTVQHREDGVMEAISPPVIGGRVAYRYRLLLTPQKRAEIPSMSDFLLDNLLSVQTAKAPERGSSRENWWWYAEDKFGPIGYSQRTPVSLMKKWKRDMLVVLLENHPHRDAKLAEWDSRLEARKEARERRRQNTKPTPKKAHGDIVVLPRPVAFADDSVKQVFRYSIDRNTFGTRAKHTLQIRGTPHRTPHSSAVPIEHALSAGQDFAPPMQAALVLVAWVRAPRNNAHALIAAEKAHADKAEAVLQVLTEWLKQSSTGASLLLREQHLLAALSALRDFVPSKPSDNLSPRATDDVNRVIAKAGAVRAILQTQLARMAASAEETISA